MSQERASTLILKDHSKIFQSMWVLESNIWIQNVLNNFYLIINHRQNKKMNFVHRLHGKVTPKNCVRFPNQFQFGLERKKLILKDADSKPNSDWFGKFWWPLSMSWKFQTKFSLVWKNHWSNTQSSTAGGPPKRLVSINAFQHLSWLEPWKALHFKDMCLIIFGFRSSDIVWQGVLTRPEMLSPYWAGLGWVANLRGI